MNSDDSPRWQGATAMRACKRRSAAACADVWAGHAQATWQPRVRPTPAIRRIEKTGDGKGFPAVRLSILLVTDDDERCLHFFDGDSVGFAHFDAGFAAKALFFVHGNSLAV